MNAITSSQHNLLNNVTQQPPVASSAKLKSDFANHQIQNIQNMPGTSSSAMVSADIIDNLQLRDFKTAKGSQLTLSNENTKALGGSRESSSASNDVESPSQRRDRMIMERVDDLRAEQRGLERQNRAYNNILSDRGTNQASRAEARSGLSDNNNRLREISGEIRRLLC